MKILLHICCAPCTIYPLQTLRNQGFQITGYFYNPNIHPFREYQKRKDTLKEYAGICKLEIFYEEKYDLELFLNRTRPLGSGALSNLLPNPSGGNGPAGPGTGLRGFQHHPPLQPLPKT